MILAKLTFKGITVLRFAFLASIVLLFPDITLAQNTVNNLFNSSNILVIGHRGASSQAPENTIAAFKLAIQQKADFVELDYYQSYDGIPVVFHDKTLDRTTNSNRVLKGKKCLATGKTFPRSQIKLETVSSSQLKLLDAGSWFDQKFKGTQIPTLEEALKVIQKGSITLIEHKSGDAETLIKLLDKLEFTEQVVVQSFDWNFLRDCRKLNNKVHLVALGSKKLDQKRLDEMKANVSGFAWNHKDVNQETIDLVHQNKKTLWVYTVNDQKEAQRLKSIGIDGIITDAPGKLRAWVQ